MVMCETGTHVPCMLISRVKILLVSGKGGGIRVDSYDGVNGCLTG